VVNIFVTDDVELEAIKLPPRMALPPDEYKIFNTAATPKYGNLESWIQNSQKNLDRQNYDSITFSSQNA